MTEQTMNEATEKTSRRWTAEEDEILLRQIDVYGHNLSKCFLIVSEMTGRSKGAVSSHWYTILSKKPDVWKYALISPRSVAKNRKNAMGTECNSSIWRRVLRIIKTVFQ